MPEEKSKFGGILEDSKFGGIPETPEQKPDEGTFLQRLGFGGTPEQRTLFGLPKETEKKVFPTASQKEKETPGKAFIAALEALETPVRAAGKLRKDPETGKRFEFGDPKSAILRPEIEKIKAKFPPGEKLPPAEAAKGLIRGGTELVGTVLSDPFTAISLIKGLLSGGKRAVSKGIKKVKEPFKPTQTKEVTEELLESAAPPKKGLEKAFSRLTEQDRSILAEPLKAKDTPFEIYSDVAEKAIQNPRNPTPLDFAGRKAVKALDDISKQRKSIGAQKGALVEASADEIIDVSDLKNKWLELLDTRMNADIRGGKIVNKFDPNRPLKRSSELPMLEKINNIIQGLDDEIFIVEADDIKGAINDIVANFKATQARPQNTITEGMGKEIAKNMDNKLREVLGEEFGELNAQFSNLKNIEDFFSRKLGRTMETAGGEQAERGASLLKAALQSNSDRNTRALFQQVLDLTGVDLVKDAKFAEIAMRSVDDPRIKGLLEEISKTVPGKFGIAAGTAQKLTDKIRKPLSKEIKEFAAKQQRVKVPGTRLPAEDVIGAITRKPGTAGALLDLIRGEEFGQLQE